MTASPAVLDRASDLLDAHRVVLTGRTTAMCASDSGDHYLIQATDSGIVCNCPARNDLCAHGIAAAVLWHELVEIQAAEDKLRREVFG